MPLYRYICPDGHTQKELRSRDTRHQAGVCETTLAPDPDFPGRIPFCGKPTRYADAPKPFAAPGAKIRNEDQLNGKAWHRFRCQTCGADHDLNVDVVKDPHALSRSYPCETEHVRVHNGAPVLDQTPEEAAALAGTPVLDEDGEPIVRVCPGEITVMLTTQVVSHLNRLHPGGYHDRGLGVYVRDAEHRAQVMEQLGVAEVGDEFETTMDNQIRRTADDHKRTEDEFDEMVVDMKRDGTDQQMTKAIESGQLADEQARRSVRYHGHGSDWKRKSDVDRVLRRTV